MNGEISTSQKVDSLRMFVVFQVFVGLPIDEDFSIIATVGVPYSLVLYLAGSDYIV
jgi:hypothetical protein